VSTHEIARRILGHLSNMVGARSTALATAVLPSGTLDVEAGELLSPVRGGQLDPTMPFRVKLGVTLSTTPAVVTLEPVVGGLPTNLPISTTLRWDRLTGAPDLVLDAAATGGFYRSGVSLKQWAYYEHLSRQAAQELFMAKVGLFPAGVLVWDGSDKVANVGDQRVLQRERWTIFVAVSRMDSHSKRGGDGLELADEVESRLVQAAGYGLSHFSAKPTELLGRGRLAAAPTSYVYSVTFGTFRVVCRLDDRELVAADHVNIDATTGGDVPFTVVDDNRTSLIEPFDQDPSP
jgi:hypothetical protein